MGKDGLGSLAFKQQQPLGDYMNTIPTYDIAALRKRYNTSGLSNIDSMDTGNVGEIPKAFNTNTAYNDYLKSSVDLNKAQISKLTNDPKWADVQGLGGAVDWLTSSRNGGASYAEMGLAGLSALSDFYFGRQNQKYQNKLLDLERQKQAFYENQIARQNTKEDRAQSNYDTAQAQTRVV